MKDITNEITNMVIKLEKLGRDNDYSLECESDQLEKLEYILKNVFREDESIDIIKVNR
jgi:hypothetical protein